MKTLLAVIVVVAGLAALSVGVVVATSHNSTEVRIAAKRLDDGRIEVALQQRELDGSWGRPPPANPAIHPGERSRRQVVDQLARTGGASLSSARCAAERFRAGCRGRAAVLAHTPARDRPRRALVRRQADAAAARLQGSRRDRQRLRDRVLQGDRCRGAGRRDEGQVSRRLGRHDALQAAESCRIRRADPHRHGQRLARPRAGDRLRAADLLRRARLPCAQGFGLRVDRRHGRGRHVLRVTLGGRLQRA